MLSALVLSLSAQTFTVIGAHTIRLEKATHMNMLRTRLAPLATTIAVGVIVAVMAAPLKWI